MLVATEFSTASHYALQYAVALVRGHNATIFVAHIVTPRDPSELLHDTTSLRERMAQAEAEIQHFSESVDLFGLTCIPIVQSGSLGETLEALANYHSVDLVVTGARGLNEHRPPTLGSGAEEIFRHATRPVLTIGPQAALRGMAASAPKQILCATDFSASSERAMGLALTFARRGSRRLIVLHVQDGSTLWTIPTRLHMQQISTQRMRHLVEALGGNALGLEFRVAFGSATETILSTAHEAQIDLIVLGSKSAGAWAHGAPLSTAYNVIVQASCPVLTVRS